MKINFTNIILIIISIIFILCIINNLLNDNIISKNIVDKFSSSDEKNQLKTNLNNLELIEITNKIDEYTIDTEDYENTDQEIAMHKFWFNTHNDIEYENKYFFLLNNNTRSQYRLLLRAVHDENDDYYKEIHFSGNMYELYNYLLSYSDDTIKFYKDKYIDVDVEEEFLKIADENPNNEIIFEGINNNGVYDNILNIKIDDKYITYTGDINYNDIDDDNYRPVVVNEIPDKYQFRRINFDDPKMLDIIPDYYSKKIRINIDNNGRNVDVNVKTLIDYKNNNFSVVNQNLRELSLTRGVNDALENNLMSKIDKTDTDLYNVNQYLDVMNNNPDRLINRVYVQNVIDYKNFKDEKILNKIQNDKEKFQNIENSEANNINSLNNVNIEDNSGLYSKELIDSLFPQNPEDFFGVYIIKFSDYLLLDNIKIIFKKEEIIIKNKKDEDIKSFVVRDIKKLTIPEFPNQTISISIDDKYEYNEKYDKIEELLIGKQRDFLDKIDFKNIIYLFGNDGKYTFYTQNRNKIFNVVKIE